jgi:hypothetical protein
VPPPAPGVAAEVLERFRSREVGIAIFDATPPTPTPRLLAATGSAAEGDGADVTASYPFGGALGSGTHAAAGPRARCAPGPRSRRSVRGRRRSAS